MHEKDCTEIARYSQYGDHNNFRDITLITKKIQATGDAVDSKKGLLNNSSKNIGINRSEVEEEITSDDEDSGEPVLEELTIQRSIDFTSESPDNYSDEENSAINKEILMKEIINVLGARYRFGGTNALGGIDCSAFVVTIYSRALGMNLPRTSKNQFGLGKKVKKNDLLIGDLVFFKTRIRKSSPVSHVGIYVGENCFAHASRKYGVIVSSLMSKYYSRAYLGARRIISEKITQQENPLLAE